MTVRASTVRDDLQAHQPSGSVPKIAAPPIPVDQIGGRVVEQPGMVSQTLALIVDLAIFGGLCAVSEAVFGQLGQWVDGPVLFLLPYFWRRWHRSPGMALWGLYVYRDTDPGQPIGIWQGSARFSGLLIALWFGCLFLLLTLGAAIDIALLRGVHPVDRALGLRVVRYQEPALSMGMVGRALDAMAVFASVRLTDGDRERQPLDGHGKPD